MTRGRSENLRTLALVLVGLAFGDLALAADSLIGPLTVQRTAAGLSITGTIREIPPGTKMRVEIVRRGGRALKPIDQPASDTIVGSDGSFGADLAGRDDDAFAAGTYTVQITAMFNRPWQSVDVLQKAGVELDSQGRTELHTNPKALPKTADFKPFDPEFPNAGRYIEVRREVTVAQLVGDAAAIDAVKKARLTVQGSGRSDLAVGKSVEFFASQPGFKILGWSAAQGKAGRWTVTLDCVDGDKKTQAQWEYDPRSKVVKYLDPLSKILSYVPAE
jgi:hypothetical protein